MISVFAILYQGADKTQILYSRAFFFPSTRRKIFLTKKNHIVLLSEIILFSFGAWKDKRKMRQK